MARAANEIADEEFDDADLSTETADDGAENDTPDADDGVDTGDAGDDAGDTADESRTLEPELPAEPDAEAADTAELPPEPDAEELEDPEEAEPVPFAELDGALNYAGAGVFVPEGAPLDRLRQQLEAFRSFGDERQDLTADIERLQTTRSAEASIAADVLELVFKDWEKLDVDGLYDWAIDFKARERDIRNDLREKYLDRQAEEVAQSRTARPRRASTPAAAQAATPADAAQAERVLGDTITAALTALYARPELATLTEADKTRLSARAAERSRQLTMVAADDSLGVHGIKKGDAYLNTQQIYEWANDIAATRAEERQTRSAAGSIAARNARRLGSGVARPPVPGAAARTKADPDEWKPATTREEWRARMEMD